MTFLKVAHLTSVHPRYDTRIFVKMCVSTAQAGYETHLVVADNQGDEEQQGVYFHDVGAKAGNRITRGLSALTSVYKKAVKIKADIYHFHDPELMIVGLLLKLRGNKVVFDVHEDLPRQILRKTWIPALLRKPISLVARMAEYVTAKAVDAVVTVTPTIAKRFEHTRVIEARNYASLTEFDGITKDNSLKTKNTYIGGITKDRGILPMVSAFSERDIRFTLAGKFQESGLQARAEALNGWQNTDFLGWQSRDEIRALLGETLVGLVVLQPTGDYEDAFPVKMFEYMASGAAVIASDFPLWREIVEEVGCGVCVDPTDPEAIAKALTQLNENKDKAIAMGENGIKAIQDKYNWQMEANKLLALYQSLAAK